MKIKKVIKNNKYKFLAFTLLIVFIVLITLNITAIYRNIFEFLSYESKIKKSDIIYAVSGELSYRLPIVIDLYKKNMANSIVITTTKPSIIYKSFLDTYYPELYESKVIMKILTEQRIPSEKIKILPDSVSSITDIKMLKTYYNKNKFQSAIVVTSPYHCRRLKLAIDTYFDEQDIQFSYYSGNNPNYIYTAFNEKKDFYLVTTFEFMKLVYYYLVV